jgi:hypothetical protein
MQPVCDYEGCNEPVCEEDMKLQAGMQFCQKHSDELEAFVIVADAKGILKFWIQSNGGPHNMALEDSKYYRRIQK